MAAVDVCVNRIRDLLQHAVAPEMAARIVDLFEVIHVEDGEREVESTCVGE